ncbi:MAG: hypothetical protein Q4P32_07080 [Micrococcales bacterium]|nr:hypothetical protein [Micrococcales bacterium]
MSTSPAAVPDHEQPARRIGSAAYRRITLALFLAGLATFALLYATQPLLPLLASDFGVSPGESAWSVSLATAGLGAALLLAGPLSEVGGRTRLMHASRLLLPASRRFHRKPARLSQLIASSRGLICDPAMWCLFGIAGCTMGAFVGVFNALGFRLESPPYALGVGVAGLVYLSYALGSVSSAWAGRAATVVGHRTVEPLLVVAMIAGLLLTLSSPLPLVICGVAVFTAGFFGAHGVASGWVASRASLSTGTPGQASSLYLFFYYLGSSIAGSLAGIAWSRDGWPGVGALTGGLLVLALSCTLALRRIPSLLEPPGPDPGIVGY